MSTAEPDGSSAARGVAIAAVRETLSRSTDVDSCVALAARVAVLMSEAVEYFRKEQTGIACRVGCSFCCHLRVMIYPHEAIALFRYLGARMPRAQADGVRQRLQANAARMTASHEAGIARLACAFLVDGQCSAYEVRPVACSGYHSLSRERCEEAHDSAGSAAIPVSQAIQHLAGALNDGLEQGLAAAGLSGAQVELQTALAALLRAPTLIERWRSGGQWARDARGLVRQK